MIQKDRATLNDGLELSHLVTLKPNVHTRQWLVQGTNCWASEFVLGSATNSVGRYQKESTLDISSQPVNNITIICLFATQTQCQGINIEYFHFLEKNIILGILLLNIRGS